MVTPEVGLEAPLPPFGKLEVALSGVERPRGGEGKQSKCWEGSGREQLNLLNMDKVQIIILAAGLGKRMKNKELPKALVLFKGQPLIKYLLASIKNSGVCDKPVIVVGKMAEKVKEILGPNYIYVFQAEQLGTGHAVMCAKDALAGKAENILVLYGDQPLITPQTIKELTETHLTSGGVLTIGTVKVLDFNDWRAGFYDFGRINRDLLGNVIGIIEKKDATAEQLNIKEINPGYYCFKAEWLWQNLDKLKNTNAQGEYYLTDLVGLACQQGQKIETVFVEPKEALGINTEEQLEAMEKLL